MYMIKIGSLVVREVGSFNEAVQTAKAVFTAGTKQVSVIQGGEILWSNGRLLG